MRVHVFAVCVSMAGRSVQEEAAAIKGKMQARADQLMATYTQIALQVLGVHMRIACLMPAQPATPALAAGG